MKPIHSQRWGATLLGILVLSVSGCARSRYHYGRERVLVPYSEPEAIAVRTGEPNPRLDRWEHSLRYPFRKWNDWFGTGSAVGEKEREWNRSQAVSTAVTYLQDNGLDEVYVDVRVHDPIEDWRRLVNNRDIHPVWRYTDGSLRVALSSLFPGRVLGIDRYNPYTKTLSLNSTRPASAIYRAAMAKDSLLSPMPGVLAVSQYAPIVPVWQHSRVSTDVLSYAKAREDHQLLKRLYPTCYAQVGKSVLSEGFSLTPAAGAAPFFVGPAVSVVGRTAGYMVGKATAKGLGEPDKNSPLAVEPTTEESLQIRSRFITRRMEMCPFVRLRWD